MYKEKTNNRKTKSIETKQKIYEAAEQLFGKHGFDKVSVDSIVEMAGVSKGSFYVHFDSKNSLIAALISNYVYKVDLDYKSYLESFPDGTMASDLLISLVGKIIDIITDYIGYDHMRIVYQVLIARTLNTDSILGYNRDLYNTFNIVINKGIQQGEFNAGVPVDEITNHCVMATRGLTYEWCIRYPDFDLKGQAIKHFEMLLSGIKKR